MIKVYFGPYKRSPVKPLGSGEATLSIGDFNLLRGYDRDFWTNNPFVLDCFDPKQVMVWNGDAWVELPDAVAAEVPSAELETTVAMPNGKLALFVEVSRLVDLHTAEYVDAERIRAEIRAALLH